MAASRSQINVLNDIAASRYQEVLDALGVRLHSRGRYLSGTCPVHGGDNATALVLFPDGHQSRGNWNCLTHNCQNEFRQTFLGFIHGVLSHQKHGWKHPGDRKVSFLDTTSWVIRSLNLPHLEQLTVDLIAEERKQFIQGVRALTTGGASADPTDTTWTVEQIRNRLVIPSPYFLERGFSAEILDRFMVGESRRKGPFSDRAIVPILGMDARKVVGITARSIHPVCPQCKTYHGPVDCPSRSDRNRPEFAKWRNHGKLSRDQVLYNFGTARTAIKQSRVVVLTEGPGDVWKLVEAGVDCAVALLGRTLSEPQKVLLESSGAFRVILGLDSDSSGQQAVEEISQQLGRFFHITRLALPGHDFGSLSREAIRTLLKPWNICHSA